MLGTVLLRSQFTTVFSHIDTVHSDTDKHFVTVQYQHITTDTIDQDQDQSDQWSVDILQLSWLILVTCRARINPANSFPQWLEDSLVSRQYSTLALCCHQFPQSPVTVSLCLFLPWSVVINKRKLRESSCCSLDWLWSCYHCWADLCCGHHSTPAHDHGLVSDSITAEPVQHSSAISGSSAQLSTVLFISLIIFKTKWP